MGRVLKYGYWHIITGNKSLNDSNATHAFLQVQVHNKSATACMARRSFFAARNLCSCPKSSTTCIKVINVISSPKTYYAITTV